METCLKTTLNPDWSSSGFLVLGWWSSRCFRWLQEKIGDSPCWSMGAGVAIAAQGTKTACCCKILSSQVYHNCSCLSQASSFPQYLQWQIVSIHGTWHSMSISYPISIATLKTHRAKTHHYILFLRKKQYVSISRSLLDILKKTYNHIYIYIYSIHNNTQ